MSATYASVSTERDGVIDAALRMAEGIDRNDAEQLSSALTEDVVFDMSQIVSVAHAYEPYRGREETVRRLLAIPGRLDTMHALTNFRAHVHGSAAMLSCYLISQHFRPGEGPSADYGDFLLRGSRFEMALEREVDRNRWRIRSNVATTLWTLGDVAVTRLPDVDGPAVDGGS